MRSCFSQTLAKTGIPAETFSKTPEKRTRIRLQCLPLLSHVETKIINRTSKVKTPFFQSQVNIIRINALEYRSPIYVEQQTMLYRGNAELRSIIRLVSWVQGSRQTFGTLI